MALETLRHAATALGEGVGNSGVNVDSCYKCVRDTKHPNNASRAACGACNDVIVKDIPGCLACAAKGGKKEACGACSSDTMSPWTKQCYNCLAKGVLGDYCARPVPGILGETPIPKYLVPYMPNYFKCLEDSPKHTFSGGICWSCFHECPRAGKEAMSSCFSCIQNMSGVQTNGTEKGYYCGHCYCNWGDEKAAKPAACEACVKETKKMDEEKCVTAI